MRNASKLLALMLAFVMVLGLFPVASAQTIHTHGIEEYPELNRTLQLHIPDENSRRVGQSVAAASLPKLG